MSHQGDILRRGQDDIRRRALKCLRDKIKEVERGEELVGPILYGALIEAWMSLSDDIRRETPGAPPLSEAAFDALATRLVDVVDDLLHLLAGHVDEVMDARMEDLRARRANNTEGGKSPPATWKDPPTTPWH